MNAGRKHETPMNHIKLFFIHCITGSKAQCLYFFSYQPLVLQGMQKGSSGHCTFSTFVSQLRTLGVKKTLLFKGSRISEFNHVLKLKFSEYDQVLQAELTRWSQQKGEK